MYFYRLLLILIITCYLSACSSPSKFSQLINENKIHCSHQNVNGFKQLDKRYLLKTCDKRPDREIEYAEYSFLYAIAAQKAYEAKDSKEEKTASKEEKLSLPTAENWQEIHLRDSNGGFIGDAKGFYARTWLRTEANGNKELVISYRGTNETKDFVSANLVFFKLPGVSNQYEYAMQYAKQAIDYLKKNNITVERVVLTGHSLGGGLAEYTQRKLNTQQMSKQAPIAITFDTSPNVGRLLSLLSYKSRPYEKNAIRVYEEGEILSYLRFFVYPDMSRNPSPDCKNKNEGLRTIWYNKYKGSPFSQHSMRDLAMILIKTSALADNPIALNVIETINDNSIMPGCTVSTRSCNFSSDRSHYRSCLKR